MPNELITTAPHDTTLRTLLWIPRGQALGLKPVSNPVPGGSGVLLWRCGEGLGLGLGLRLGLGLLIGFGFGLGLGLGLGGVGVLPATSHPTFYSRGYVPTTFTRLVRCDNRVQYTSIGIK